MNDTPIRYRMKYSKTGNLRFIGHLDTQVMFERALRRTGLPLRYTQGFNKRIRLNLASALPLGFISSAEVLDFWLNEPVGEQIILQMLENALPAEIHVLEVNQTDNSLPSLQGSLVSSEYEITLPGNIVTELFEHKLDQLLAQPEVSITRRNKIIDYKPLILEYEFRKDSSDNSVAYFKLSSSPAGNARPDDILELLGIDPADCVIERTKLNFSTVEK